MAGEEKGGDSYKNRSGKAPVQPQQPRASVYRGSCKSSSLNDQHQLPTWEMFAGKLRVLQGTISCSCPEVPCHVPLRQQNQVFNCPEIGSESDAVGVVTSG